MKTNLILLIQNKSLLDVVFQKAYKSPKYANVAKYEKVAWAQLLNIKPEERNQYQCKILVDSYLDYRAYNKLLGFCKWAITHSMPCQVIVQETLETYTFEAITNRMLTGTAVRVIKYTDKHGDKCMFTKEIRKETELGPSTWQRVEQEISPLKRLFAINKRYTEEIQFKEEFATSLMQAPIELGLMEIPIQQAWEYCKIYGPAYGLDPIYLPITRDSIPKEWLLQRASKPKLDNIHDEKARLNRVLQTFPLEYEAQIRNQLAQIRYYQLHQIPWLPEYVTCPECGHPVNVVHTARINTITGKTEDDGMPHCAYCDYEDFNIDLLPENTYDPYMDLSQKEYNQLRTLAKQHKILHHLKKII